MSLRRKILGWPGALPLAVSILVALPTLHSSSAHAQRLAATDYQRAEALLSWHASLRIAGDQVDPEWMQGGNRFWYRNKTATGHEFVLVDPVLNTRAPLFDHYRLAAAMSLANDTSYLGEKLPFDDFDFVGDGETALEFREGEQRFECDIRAYTCTVGDTLAYTGHMVRSPDGNSEAFIHEYNLYVRPYGGGDSTQLTTDGERYFAYGISEPRAVDRPRPPSRPTLQWSPDSRKITVQRMDEREVEKIMLYSSTTQRPRYWIFPYAQPGDSVIPRYDIYVVDVESREARRVEFDAQDSPVLGMGGVMDSTWVTVKWSVDSDSLYFLHSTRGSKRTQVMVTDVEGNTPRLIAKDTAHTFVELHMGGRNPPNWAVANNGDDVIWFSTRDGWAHLYRYDGQGNLKNQITSGPWSVHEIKYVDDVNDRIYFTAWRSPEADEGNPYYIRLHRVSFDGSGLQLITPEDAYHDVSFTPSGRYFVDTYSRVEEPPVTVLRTVPDGQIQRTLEEADVSRLEEIGWTPASTFRVKARDGVTDLWGVIFFPPDFDSTKSYPIIDHIYPGPQRGSVRTWSFMGGGDDFALAQLGFVVIQLDHLGTPGRSKAFHDHYWGNMTDNGIPDHVTAIQQLGARYPFIDLDRVGIYGHSGGGFASTDAILTYPDFYKVAVSGAGNHDNSTYGVYWGEKYQGLMERDTLKGTDNFRSQANFRKAGNLKGKLLLMHGDLDDNVIPALTLRVVNALIDANKSFDFLIAPDRHHGLNEPYFVRRRWDYFVEHLLGTQPPANYEITRPEN